MEFVSGVLYSTAFKAALLSGLGGLAEAFRADRKALKAYIESEDPAATFHWKVALKRWAVGFAVGFVTVLLPVGGAEALF